jgi:hypothetical protein
VSVESAKVSPFLHAHSNRRSAEYRYVPPTLVSNGRLCRAPSVTAARRASSCDLQGGVRQLA